MSYKSKLITSLIAFNLLITVLLGFGGFKLVDYLAENTLQGKSLAVSKVLQPIADVGVLKNDLRLFERTAKLVLLSDEIDKIRLADSSGEVLVDQQSSKKINNGYLYEKALVKENDSYGKLSVIISEKTKNSVYNDAEILTLSIAVGISVLLLIASAFIVKIKLNRQQEISQEHVVVDTQVAQPETKEEPQNSPGPKEIAEKIGKRQKITSDIIKKSPDAIVSIDFSGKILEFNPAAEKLLGYQKNDVQNKNIKETLVLDKDLAQYEEFLDSLRDRPESMPNEFFECQFRSASDQTLDCNVFATSIETPNGIEAVIYIRDVSHQKATENRLNYLAFNDELTDLPNLSLLSDHIRKALFEADKNERQIVVIKLGLDRFKHINESLGHRFGDYLIRNIAGRLKSNIRRGDMVSRINGDQFVIALVDVAFDSNIDVLVQKYLDCFNEPFQVESNEIHITVSVGATIYPGDEKSVDGLLRNAESAMFRAKDKGGNNYQFFSAEMRQISQERLYMENELRKAIDLEQFELHYQPQVNLATGKIIGVEALVRWNHPSMGVVPPLKFIPLAEETGLIRPIGEWVLRHACEHNKALNDDRGQPLILAVNLSAKQFQDNDLVGSIATILNETGYPADLLELEITESLLMENMDDVAGILRILSDQGIRISMDDFGTGYSSLSYLKSFPINTLKVDRSFVQDLEDDANNASIVTATIQMAHSLKIDIVAEGVETEGQLKFLAHKKCDKIQGYYFSRPLESKALRELLDENRQIDMAGNNIRLVSG